MYRLRCGLRTLSGVGRGFKIYVAGERHWISEGQNSGLAGRDPLQNAVTCTSQVVFHAVPPISQVGCIFNTGSTVSAVTASGSEPD